MTTAALAYLGRRKAAVANTGLVYKPDPVAETLVEIRQMLDDKRLAWAIWPGGRSLNP